MAPVADARVSAGDVYERSRRIADEHFQVHNVTVGPLE